MTYFSIAHWEKVAFGCDWSIGLSFYISYKKSRGDLWDGIGTEDTPVCAPLFR